MSEQITLDLDPKTVAETSMVDLAFMILKKANNPFYYRDLMQEVARLKGLSDDEITNVIAQLYTEINIDGRFACVGQNLWGLKRWYPTDKGDDNHAGPRTRLLDDDDDDTDLYDEEYDDTADEDEDFKAVDDDEDYDKSDDDDDDDEDEEDDKNLDDDEIDLEDEEIDDDIVESDDSDEIEPSEDEEY